MKSPINIPASVRQRLLNQSRRDRRRTELPEEIEAFTESFIDEKQVQWTAFWRRLQQDNVPTSFSDVTTSIDRFLSPVIEALSSGKPCPTNWTAPGPWS